MTQRSRRITPPSWATLLLVFFIFSLFLLLQSGTLQQVPGTSPRVEAPESEPSSSVQTSVETAVLRGYRGPWYQVYFTNPVYPEGPKNRAGGLDEALVADIMQAQRSVRLASFDLDLETVVDVLLEAHNRGIDVQLTIDAENLHDPLVSNLMGALEAAGVGVFYDRRSAFMHNKIAVIDDRVVWTGSWNFTINDTFRNNNNMIRVIDEQLAQNYIAKLDKIFKGQGGPGQRSITSYPEIAFENAPVTPLFSPEDPVTDVIVEWIDQAQNSVDIMAFAFTSDLITDAFITARERGVAVRVVMENRNARGTGSEFDKLREASIDIHPDGNCYIMHHKAIIVDGQRVITGSFNFTASAQDHNDENVLLINDRSVAALYNAEFERIYAQALDPMPCSN